MLSNNKPKQETDLPWKYILSLYFKSFMELCWANRASEINWKKKPKFLDKELIKITKDAATGNKVVDKLIEVELINGNRCRILIHLEIQATSNPDFNKRMFVYRYRLREVYEQPIASMAILLDGDPSWRPDSYSESLWDSSITMKFPIIKLIDYNNQIEELEQSSNPFAIIILAQLAALKKQDVGLRLASKLHITRKLYSLGFNKKEILALFKFIDWIIALPKQSEIKYMRNVAKLEQEEFGKNFICPAEQIWLEKGIGQGIEQGIHAIAIKMIAAKLPLKTIIKITGLSVDQIQKLKSSKAKSRKKA